MSLPIKDEKLKVAEICGGVLEKIIKPISFINKNPQVFQEVIYVVRAAFGSEMTEEDIKTHFICPDETYILFLGQKVGGVGFYTHKKIISEPLLYVEGVAFHPDMQGHDVFRNLTNQVKRGEEKFLGLKTQNPRMHRALEKICSTICPSLDCEIICSSKNGEDCKISNKLYNIRNNFAKEINANIDELGVVRGAYGKSLYANNIPFHSKSSKLFNKILKLDYLAGDSIVCIGMI